MEYVTKEEVSRAREMALLTYLMCHEPQELVKLSSSVYTTRSHDSVKISNGKWYRFSTNEGGVSALDYLVKVEHVPFVQAVKLINRQDEAVRPASFVSQRNAKAAQPKCKLLLPAKAPNNMQITNYLLSRGICREVIDYCIQQRLIYESLPHHSLVFIGYDNQGTARYGGFRAISNERIMGDCSGSSKRYSFRIINPESDRLHLFESVIDLMSYATVMTLMKRDWKETSYMSMAGVYAPSTAKLPISLKEYFAKAGKQKVYIHFDNDTAGITASNMLARALAEEGMEAEIVLPPEGKDFNDYLMIKKGMKRK